MAARPQSDFSVEGSAYTQSLRKAALTLKKNHKLFFVALAAKKLVASRSLAGIYRCKPGVNTAAF
jgi:hypothetical protein